MAVIRWKMRVATSSARSALRVAAPWPCSRSRRPRLRWQAWRRAARSRSSRAAMRLAWARRSVSVHSRRPCLGGPGCGPAGWRSRWRRRCEVGGAGRWPVGGHATRPADPWSPRRAGREGTPPAVDRPGGAGRCPVTPATRGRVPRYRGRSRCPGSGGSGTRNSSTGSVPATTSRAWSAWAPTHDATAVHAAMVTTWQAHGCPGTPIRSSTLRWRVWGAGSAQAGTPQRGPRRSGRQGGGAGHARPAATSTGAPRGAGPRPTTRPAPSPDATPATPSPRTPDPPTRGQGPDRSRTPTRHRRSTTRPTTNGEVEIEVRNCHDSSHHTGPTAMTVVFLSPRTGRKPRHPLRRPGAGSRADGPGGPRDVAAAGEHDADCAFLLTSAHGHRDCAPGAA